MDKRLVEKKYFLWRMFTFSGYISPGQFWSEIALGIIGFFCAMIILCMVLSATMTGSVEEIIDRTYVWLRLISIFWVIRFAALSRRRLRDAGYSAKSYLWLLIPVIGQIAFIARLCAKTVKRKPDEIWFDYD